MRYSLTAEVISVLALVGCAQAPPPAPPDTRAADEKALKDDEVAWNKDWASKDVAKVISHYADDAELEVPDMQVLKTKDDMRNAIKQIESDPNWSISFASRPSRCCAKSLPPGASASSFPRTRDCC